MVSHIGVAQAGRYPSGAGQCDKEQRLMLAVAVSPLQNNAGFIVLGAEALGVGVVLEAIPDEIVEGDGLLPGSIQPLGQLLRFLFDRSRVPVDNLGGLEILVHSNSDDRGLKGWMSRVEVIISELPV